MTLASGQTLGHYRIAGPVGSGGMGQVFKARDTRLDRDVALKVLPPELTNDSEALQRLEREARAVAALNHPNIVTLHSIEDDAGVRFLTMEFVAGKTLSELIPSSGFPVAQAITIGATIADALAAAHERGIAHRDLKPNNVMVDRDGRIKILDFGLAVHAAADGSASTTALTMGRGIVAGTVGYMAPEQLKGEIADTRADLFALGVVLHRMLTGGPPFRGQSSPEIVSAVLRDAPDPITRPDVPLQLARIVARCLEKDPRKRVQSAADLRDELRDVARETAAEQPPPASSPPARRPFVVIGGAAVLLCLAAAFIVLFVRGWPWGGPPRIQSLAVLPFENLMKDPAQDYFVDGLHDSLLTQLAVTPGVRVISRTSVQRYRTDRKTIPEIARELNVDAVIEGSVLRADNRVRISAQLIRGADDTHLWARSYDRDVRDVLGLIGDVSAAIAGEVGAAVGRPSASPPKPVRPEAADAILRGRYMNQIWSDESTRRSLNFFEQAIALDPDAAEAWARIANTHVARAFFGFSPIEEELPAARDAAERALRLDPQNAIATSALGFMALYFDWDWPRARPLLEKGLALGPAEMPTRHAMADYWMIMGNQEESLRQVRVGLSYDPLSPGANFIVAFHMIAARHYDEAAVFARRMRITFHEVPSVQQVAGDALWAAAQYEEALDAWKDSEKVAPPERRVSGLIENAYRKGGARAAMQVLADWVAVHSPQDEMQIATDYSRAENADAVFAWLERAFRQRRPSLLHVTALPSFDFIRGDPRYATLIRRIGLPAAAR
jgi:serine/threonine-protein kinase